MLHGRGGQDSGCSCTINSRIFTVERRRIEHELAVSIREDGPFHHNLIISTKSSASSEKECRLSFPIHRQSCPRHEPRLVCLAIACTTTS